MTDSGMSKQPHQHATLFDPTAIRTRAGAAVTGGGGVKGFVPRP